VPKNIIADSSAIVAFLSRDDHHHAWMTAQVNSLLAPWLTCEPALTEAFYLIGEKGEPRLNDLLRRGAVVLSFNLGPELEAVLGLKCKYAEVPMSLADACLVRMTETLPDPVIVTTDADFKIYRRHGRQVVPYLMP
jgi:predicted nucleic acid-binding protein